NLIRLEESGSVFLPSYMNAYGVLWNTTQTHQNAYFNMVDRALQGPNAIRDQETKQWLNDWLQRSRRDYWVDLRSKYQACGAPDLQRVAHCVGRACLIAGRKGCC